MILHSHGQQLNRHQHDPNNQNSKAKKLGFYQAHLSQNYAQKLLFLNMKMRFTQFLNELIYIKISLSERDKRLNALKNEIKHQLHKTIRKKALKGIGPLPKNTMLALKKLNDKILKLDEEYKNNQAV